MVVGCVFCLPFTADSEACETTPDRARPKKACVFSVWSSYYYSSFRFRCVAERNQNLTVKRLLPVPVVFLDQVFPGLEINASILNLPSEAS